MPKESEEVSRSGASMPSGGHSIKSTVKLSKFKPSTKVDQGRRQALTVFSTPGFQPSKERSFPVSRSKKEIVDVSSDSAPSSPTRKNNKRNSSEFSISEEHSPHPSKRQKKVINEEKENILSFSHKTNQAINSQGRQSNNRKHQDLFSKSTETLRQYQIYGLYLRNYITDESLENNTGYVKEKDSTLLDDIRNIIRSRLQAIESHILKSEDKKEDASQHSLPSRDQCRRVEGTASYGRENWFDKHAIPAELNDAASDDEYWKSVEDISMHDPYASPCPDPPSTSTAVIPLVRNNFSKAISSPYHKEVMDALQQTFQLSTFRPNQFEAITAALDGRDVFVLMPTGGGKSLCFQLPAICTCGKTNGVTIVVSPLIALMKDQVESLVKKGIDAMLSNSDMVSNDWHRLITNDQKPKLWYVTPEKLRDSQKANEILSILYRNNQLARFVIDEAHCISTWGQDFRVAYTSLGLLRENYPTVPIMALTATADNRTVADIVTQLKLEDHASFTQSFNRTNLKYMVQRKTARALDDIIGFITERHKDEGGVIYCNARNTCEKVAKKLRDGGIKAAHFHAGMPPIEKDNTVRDWQSGEVSVIVATIAFGMGIDKANVRYVIHYDMPKSMSGYYQETGRAGRDGKIADCLMLYSGHDLQSLIHLIKTNEESTADSKKRQENAAREVFQFCENTSECRRVQILQHFDERFDKRLCARGCDICQDDRETVSANVTAYAHDIIALVKNRVEKCREKVSFSLLQDILRGGNTKDIRERGYDKLSQYGLCSELPRELLELLLNRLLGLDVLGNVSHLNVNGFHSRYIELGEMAKSFSSEREELILNYRPKPKREGGKKKTRPGDSISASVKSSKGKQRAIEMDDPITNFDNIDELDDHHHNIYTTTPAPESRIDLTISLTDKKTTPNSPITSRQPQCDSVEVLYKKMLELREEIVAKEGLMDEHGVFDDDTLWCLSATCPDDYNSFQNSILDIQGAKAVNGGWNKYGHLFLGLCIQEKAKTVSDKQAPKQFPPKSLHSLYDYQSPARSPLNISSSSGVKKKAPKFKPAVPVKSI